MVQPKLSPSFGSPAATLGLTMMAAGCDVDPGYTVVERWAPVDYCSNETELMEAGELDAMGVSTADLLAHASPQSVGWVDTVDGESEEARIWFAADMASTRKQVWNDQGDAACSPSSLFFDGTMRIVSESGLLDESLTVAFEAMPGSDSRYSLRMGRSLEAGELQGSLTPTDFIDEPGSELVGLSLSGSFTNGSFVGVLAAHAERYNRQTVEGSMHEILTLSTESVEPMIAREPWLEVAQ